MSWLFGKSKNTQNTPPGAPPPPINPKDDENIQKNKVNVGGYGFDSEALERAAKAAKELEQSKYAKEAFNISKDHEHTQQMKYQTDLKANEVALEQAKTEHFRTQQQERQRLMEEETRQQKARADYQDHLSRKRKQDEIAQTERFQLEQLKRQEESIAKQEQMKRKTVEYEAELHHQYSLKEIEAKQLAKAKAERENHALIMEKMRLSAEENRETVLTSINNIGTIVGNGLNDFFHDKSKVATLVAGITLTFGGVYGMKTTFRFIENRIGKPSLIRETSRFNVFDLAKHPIKTIKSRLNKPTDPLANIVLNVHLEERLRRLAIATRHTRANKGYYRNVLLYGPPGTGKTFYAKSLAKASNMDYAIMSGGDVTPLGEKGVSEMHKIFDWSITSKRGLILFIDEADAFLYKRNQVQISEHLRSTLNAFLQRTGEQSKNFMVVFATNAPEQFDWAVNSRIDEVVNFPLPNLEERIRLFRQYFYQFILLPASLKTHRIKLQEIIPPKDGENLGENEEGHRIDWEHKMELIAHETEGLSGRDISKIAVDWQASAYSSDDGILTLHMVDRIVAQAMEGYRHKEAWKHFKLPTMLTGGAGLNIKTTEADFTPIQSDKKVQVAEGSKDFKS